MLRDIDKAQLAMRVGGEHVGPSRQRLDKAYRAFAEHVRPVLISAGPASAGRHEVHVRLAA